MVTTKQEPPIVDTQKMKRKEFKHTTTENHQVTKKESKRKGIKELKEKTFNKVHTNQ